MGQSQTTEQNDHKQHAAEQARKSVSGGGGSISKAMQAPAVHLGARRISKGPNSEAFGLLIFDAKNTDER